MVKVTGRTRDPAHLAAHITYITRNGKLPVEDRDGCDLLGRGEVLELADDWSALGLSDSRRRTKSPLSVNLILSMPPGTDPIRLSAAVRAFASSEFAENFDYLLAVHTDTRHPHVHLTIRALGDDGSRLSPKKADLEAWRRGFAEALREQGIDAEATPRRARGVTRKAERTALRKIRERSEAGSGPMSRSMQQAYREAAQAAFGEGGGPRTWEAAIVQRQRRVRALYLAQAKLLEMSPNAEDRALGKSVNAFLDSVPQPDTRRLWLARQLREINARLQEPGPAEQGRREKGRDLT
jgi:hypothetical protein